MPLLGAAAMLLWYDIVPEQVAEHDEWHTRQHFPERVGIPGFLRAQRWVSEDASPRYLVSYEVRDIDVLSSAAYRERLDNPTEWTQQIMPHFRGMVRGFCQQESSHGTVVGASVLSVRYTMRRGCEAEMARWLNGGLLASLAQRRGVVSVDALASAKEPEMTAEQRLRGRDAGVDRILLVTSYVRDALVDLEASVLGRAALEAHGAATGSLAAIYQLACRADAATPGVVALT
jgi:hypothetical protein